ncbi:MAG: hypothetical protein ACOY33_06405 [Pseudomonadota bacterium]
MNSAFRLLAAALLPLVLVACDNDDDKPRAASGAKLTGSVVKGLTANAVITVTSPDGTLLATDESNAQGAYSLFLPAGYQGAILVTATARDYTAADIPPAERTRMRCDALSGCGPMPVDDIGNLDGDNQVDFGEWFEVPLDFRLSAVMAVNGWGIHLANVTPLSTLAARWAVMFPQGLDAESANTANTTVAAMFGMALSDFEQGTGDLADPLWLRQADPKQIQLAALYATFAEIASQFGLTPQYVVDTVADYFAGQGGSLLEAGSGSEPSISLFVNTSQTLLNNALLAGVIDMPDDSYSSVMNANNTLLGMLEHGKFTDVQPVTYEHLIGKLGPLGTQIDELLVLTGLNDPHQFIIDQAPYFAWLVTEDNLNLAPLGIETVMYALLASLQIDLAVEGTTSVVLYEEPGTYVVTLDVPNKTLTLVGTRYGQVANIEIGLTGFISGAEAGNFVYSIDATAANPTASGEIHGTLTIDTGATDFQPLLDAFAAMQASDPTALIQLQAAINTLAYSLTADVTLTGNAQLVNSSDPALALGGDVTLTGELDLGAQPGEQIARLDVTAGQIFMPGAPGEPNHLYAYDGLPILTVVVGDNATLVLDGAGTLFGIPEAIAHASGQLDNSRALFEHIRSTLLGVVNNPGSLNLGTLVGDLLDFDFSQLALHGEGTIVIPELGHEYRATLENLTATIYQPYSEEVALTAMLDIDNQRVHFELGADAEPWDLRVLTTPTPRLALIGPDGQYGEVSQEDLYAFLDTLPLGELLGSLFPASAP